MGQINVGAIANDATGDPLRTAFQKVNKFTPIADKILHAGSAEFGSGTIEQRITNAIGAAAALGTGAMVYVPTSMLPYNPASVSFNTAVRMVREGGNWAEFEVEAYGASTSGDATAAIQAALDAQHVINGIVRLDGKTYNVSQLKFYSGTVLYGRAMRSTTNAPGTQLNQATAATSILAPASTATPTSGFFFRDFSINAFGNTNNQGGLDCTNCTDYSIEDVLVNFTNVYGVRVVGGNVAGDAGFAHFTRVVVNGTTVGAYSWIISSSATDQPDGLTFTDCRTSTAQGTWIRYQTVGGRPGPGSQSWKGCTFESSGGAAIADITFDATGAGTVVFDACRFENTGSGGIQVTLNGSGVQPAAIFDSCVFAPGSGGLTWTDNGPFLSPVVNTNFPPGFILTKLLGVRTLTKSISSNYTALYQDCLILVNAAGGVVTVTLPNPASPPGVQAGQILRIVKTDSSTNTVIVQSAIGTINGLANKGLTSQYQSMDVQSDGTNYFIVAMHGATATATFPAFVVPAGGSIAFPDSTQYLQGASGQFVFAVASTNRLQITASVLSPLAAAGLTLGTSALPFGSIFSSAATTDGQVALTSGTTPAVNAQAGNYQTLNILTNIAVVIAVPSNPPAAGQSQDLFITIRNGSGGALSTAPTFNTGANGFKFAGGSIVNPANGTQAVYHWRWDPVQSFWYLVTVSTAL